MPTNVLFLMTDQQRYDTIASLGNLKIHTPNLDRLVRRGVSLTRAYSTCPVCVPARYTIRTGCEPPTTRVFENRISAPATGQPDTMQGRCGPYLAQTLAGLGYRTFGIGKFHTSPWDEELGYEVHLHSEELYRNPDQRARDSYAAWLAENYPGYAHVEQPHGERTEMYYMPQTSPYPAEATVEAWAADRAVEQIKIDDPRPVFGFVSFIGPHPPFAPPVPYNRMYDPDTMGDPVVGDLAVDHADEQIPWMNHLIWADDISPARARSLRARYYAEITYIDEQIGRILDAVEKRDDADDWLICFFADHGDHMGDHHAWQKESFFEGSCHIPMLISWPAKLPADVQRDELACLTDLFGVATTAAGAPQLRDGADLLGTLLGQAEPRRNIIGSYGEPGSPQFKLMVREDRWKFIFLANGGRRLLFDLEADPHEQTDQAEANPEVVARLEGKAAEFCDHPGARDALEAGRLRTFDFQTRPMRRIYQFDASSGVRGFPETPADVLQ